MALLACGGAEAPPGAGAPAAPAAAERPWFADVSAELGLDFRHRSGVDGSYFVPEHLGSGGALFDYDGDGDLDLYLVDSGAHGGGGGPAPNRLYRQEAGGRLVEVAGAAGGGDLGYGMGVAVGDVDGDGAPDLFLTNHGRDALYRNLGDGSFRRLDAAGLAEEAWSTSACFLDFDGDGRLDLYVATYVHHDPAAVCTDRAGRREYCGPASFRGQPDLLYRNLGGGRLREVGSAAGIADVASKGLGVVCADFDGDGRTDVYVANDGEKNDLWINRGDGTFVERAVLLGAAFNDRGEAEASMGIALGDVDGDLDLDLFMSHLDRETNTLYRSLGRRGFEDATAATGLGPGSLAHTGFGAGFFDAENDGDLDLVVVNGRVRRSELAERAPELEPGAITAAALERFWRDYAELNLLLLNDGAGRFADGCDRAGELCSRAEVSRGLVFGDLDRDGREDLLVTNCNGPARIYRNRSPAAGRWLAVRPLAGSPPRPAVGARVLATAAGRSQLRELSATYSYLSAAEPEARFGLADAASVDRLEIVWPGGGRTVLRGLPADRRLIVGRGAARRESS